ncbi:hypothetical protein CI15_00235 [Paraburkholderia monticola]|uniref:Uncharacterized protein n=1 Tax=Paraburkholderia monticola TaxID=1399968 RepID=A0A149Q1G1_9BURK|nr:hypothetical protein CI15_00235 [Paraburkholderia monticola]
MATGMAAVDGMAAAGTAGTVGTADGTAVETVACTAAGARGTVVAGWGDMGTGIDVSTHR